MNERIKELAIQAGFFYEDYKDIWYLEYHNETCEEEVKKFAELIVRECAKFLDENSGYDDSNNAWHPEPEDLLKHFGVEE
jgi:hypothetical protein